MRRFEKVNKRFKQKTTEKKSQKRIIGSSNDSKTYVEDNILEIVTTSRRKIGGKKVPLNVIDSSLDNLSFHSVANIQKSKSPPSDDIPSLEQISMEITCVHVSKWPKKNGIPIGSFIVKYVMIYRIGSSNSIPTNKKSNITSGLAKLIFQIVTKAKIKFGEFVFEQTIKHAGLIIVKIPIAFICLISGIILKQHPDIVNRGDIKSKRDVPLSFYKKLFIGTRVLDMVMLKHKGQIIGGNSSPIAKPTRTNVLLVLKETSTDLQDTITSSSLRKQEVDELISLMKNGNNVATEEAVEDEEENAEENGADIDEAEQFANKN
ncbi:hypothetical protein KIW84_072070 [Lathyrus oleraceus]|uniref:Envelope-like protein n=1 Tax=Pisum sativum TaxID=3888 RepID=A0A9D4ZVJ7_PEA|nr:hypothetical protein KIW84_072070 [Pisum sativum]